MKKGKKAQNNKIITINCLWMIYMISVIIILKIKYLEWTIWFKSKNKIKNNNKIKMKILLILKG